MSDGGVGVGMPYGYTCDKCGGFVAERYPAIAKDADFGPQPTPSVAFHDPTMDSDSGPDIKEYTLCDGCRSKLIKFVEGPAA